MAGSWKVEISFDEKKFVATVDDQMRIKFLEASATPTIDEMQRMMVAVMNVVYFLKNNSGTKFEVSEQT